MRNPTVLMLACAAVLVAQFAPDDSTRLSFRVPAFSRTGERSIEARDVYLDTFSKKGQAIKRRLFLLFDPVTRYFLFTYIGLGNVDEAIERDKRLIQTDGERTTVRYASYVSEGGILLVTPGKPIIGITESREKAASMDDAQQRAIRMLTEDVLQASREVGWPATKQVALLDRQGMNGLLGPDFYAPPMSPVAGPISVVGIAQSAVGWEITLLGQYKARVTLSPTFQPLKAERVDPPAR